MSKNLFVAATGQSDGKTTTSIGLFDIFRENKFKVGFIKPVGQRYINVGNDQIDKDSYLIEQIFQSKCNIRDMSPIAIPSGYTTQYIENRHDLKEELRDRLDYSFKCISEKNDLVIVEGTGHAGVGSVLDLSNAKVASLTHSKVIIIAPGGIGYTVDEVMLNKALFDKENVEILGVIVNKVIEDKYEKTKKLVTQALSYQNIPVLGCIPYRASLSSPNMALIQENLKQAICLNKCSTSYKNINKIVVAAMTPKHVVEHLEKGSLLIVPGDRHTVIEAVISASACIPEKHVRGIILTGGILPRKKTLDMLTNHDIPILSVPFETYEASKLVSKLLVKITHNDVNKIQLAKELIREFVDTDAILERL
jgi:BioD-like phosphotransacetylase family protein